MKASRRFIAIGIMVLVGVTAYVALQRRALRSSPPAASSAPRHIGVVPTGPPAKVEPPRQATPEVAPPAAQEKETAVAGIVVSDREPANGATVVVLDIDHPFIAPRTVETESGGRFHVSLPQGDWSLHAELNQLVSLPREVRIGRDDDHEEIRLTLVHTGIIEGSVLDPDGRPFPGGHVIWIAQEEWHHEARGERLPAGFQRSVLCGCPTPDEQGRFRVQVPAGKIELHACAEGLASGGARVDVRAGKTVSVELHLSVPRKLLVHVYDAAHHPIAGAKVEVYYQGRVEADPYPFWYHLHAGDDGSVLVQGLATGNVWAEASAEGFATGSSLAEGAAEEVEVTLLRTGTVRGRVILHGGAPCVGARVGLWPAADAGVAPEPHGESVREDGTFEMKGTEPGRYVVFAFAQGCAHTPSEEFEVPAGETVEGVVVEMLTSASVQGKVFNEKTGTPVAGAVIMWVRDSKSHHSEFSITADEQGRFTWTGFPPGPLKLRIGGRGDTLREFLLDLREGETVQRDFAVGRGTHAKVRIVPRDAKLLEDTSADFHRLDDFLRHSESHRRPPDCYESEELEPGTWCVSVQAWTSDHRRAQRRQVFEVDGQSDVEMEIPLSDVPIARVTVRRGGKPLADGLLSFVGVGSLEGTVFDAWTDESGQDQIHGMPPGEYYVCASKSDPVETDAVTGKVRLSRPEHSPVIRIESATEDSAFDIDLPAQ